jgi:hypothetical protein
VEDKCLMLKEEMAFMNNVGFTITTDLGNLRYFGYMYLTALFCMGVKLGR